MSGWGAPSDRREPDRVPAGPDAPLADHLRPTGAGGVVGPHDPRPAGRGRTVAVVVLALLLAAALVAATYLWVTTSRWQESSAGWERSSRDLGERVANLQEDLDGATGELTAVREQLTTAQSRITDLANEKAQLGDENVASQQYLDYQERVSTAAGSVAAALESCTDGQSELIGYLATPDAYDAADLERFSSEVDALCQSALDANDALQKELEK